MGAKEIKDSLVCGGACEAAAAEQWEKAFHAVGEGLFIVDREFRILQANEAFAELLGASPDELVGRRCFTLVHGTEEPPESCVLGRAIREGTSARAELFEPDLDKHLAVSVDPSFDTSGEFEFAVHTARDITVQKRAEQELLSRHGLLESLIEAMPSPVFFKDASGVYLGCNQAFVEYIGHSREEVIGGTVYDIAPKELADLYWEADEKLLANTGKQVYETRVEYADGSLRDVIFTKATFTDAGGEVRGIVGMILDITERKRAEEGLKDSEARYRMLMDTLNEGIWAIDAGGLTNFANRRMAEMLGYDVEEMLGKHLFDFMDDEGRRVAEDNLERRRQGVKEQHDFEFRRKDGGSFIATLETAPFVDADGEYAGAIAAVMDITARKESEEKLLAAERMYRELAETLPQVVFETDISGRITFSNRKGYELFGYTEDNLRDGVNVLEVIDPVDHERIFNAVAKMGDGRSTGALREYLAKRGDGSTFPCEVETTLVADAVGNPTGIRGILTDITGRKAAEEELRRSEETLQTIFDSIPGLAFFKDRQNILLRVNKTLSDALGMPAEEIVGRPLSELFPNQSKEYWKDDLEVIESGEPKLGIEESMDTPQGTRWLQTDKIPYRDAAGEIIGIVGFSVDITERRKAEEALGVAYSVLEEREARLHGLSEAAKDAMILLDGTGSIILWNPAAEKIFGYPAAEATGMPVVMLMQKEYREQHHEHEFGHYILSEDLTGDSPVEYPGLRKDGSVFPAEISISAFSLEGERYVEVVIRDISERKRAEDSLRESEERMRVILEASPFGMILVDEDRGIIDINSAAAKLTGYRKEELVGKVCHDLVCPGEEGTCPIYDFGLEVSNRESTMLNRYGESIPVLKTAVPITISGKRVLLEMIADITEQKRTEEDLQHINAELDGFAHTVSHDLKGPLAAIKSAGEILETLVGMPLTVETKADIVEMARVISEGADRSAALINEVLALAAAGQAPVEVGEVDVGEVVSRVVTERDAVITEKGIRVERSSNLGLVRANPTHIYQVFTNLIGNAIKHNDSASPVISVSYLGEDRSGGRRYLVRDNGSGITPGNLKKVFIPFFKGETGETGIGLSTVEKIVKIYGGRIRAYNDGGACFEFVLRDYAEQ